MAPSDHTLRIRQLNDRFREWTFPPLGELMVTASLTALDLDDFMAVMTKIREFDAFTEDNDPHGEHDFGAFDHAGTTYFWKIDYYDRLKEYGSPDPADPSVTCRVMTVMRADEY